MASESFLMGSRTINWIESLVNNNIPESLHLDYKSGAALSQSDHAKNEISKDIAAFANSDGGIIIYGVESKGVYPVAIKGNSDRKISSEWLYQVINSNITPRPNDVSISQIEVCPRMLVRNQSNTDRELVYVVEVPKSSTAHQSKDKRYYKRHGTECVPMEHYEVLDTLNRQEGPVLTCEIRLKDGQTAVNIPETRIVTFEVLSQNLGGGVVLYSILSLGVDSRLGVRRSAEYSMVKEGAQFDPLEDKKCTMIKINRGVPGTMPMWRGVWFQTAEITATVPETFANESTPFAIRWQYDAPGMGIRGGVKLFRVEGNKLVPVDMP